MKDRIIVTTFEELKSLIKENTNYFELDFSFLSRSENLKYTSRLVSNINTCGCRQGRIGATVASILFLILFLFFKTHLPFEILWLNVLLFLFGGAIIGKLFGKLYAIFSLRRMVLLLKRKCALQTVF